jgi:hypothetical protein|tara:strand:- start:635 stop:1000 length:366 start_codon:yes stop_codon:yes gene_type:complete
MSRWSTIILALVIALQSVVAIGDVVQPHHLKAPQHTHEYEHSHSSVVIESSIPDAEQSSTSSETPLDHSSDHCHQNHCHFHMALIDAAIDMANLSADQHLSDYQANHTSITPPSLFRPPIA